MQKCFIKPEIIDNQNPQQEKSQSLQQYSSSIDVDGQGSNPKGIQGNLSANNSGNNAQNVRHNKPNVSSSIDHYLSEMGIKEDLCESNETEENNEKQTDDEQSSYEDSAKHISPLKSIDVDETFLVLSVVGKSISHKEKLTLLNKQPRQPQKVVLLKRKKIGKRD